MPDDSPHIGVLRHILLGLMHMGSAISHHEAMLPGDSPAIGSLRRAQASFQEASDKLDEMTKPAEPEPEPEPEDAPPQPDTGITTITPESEPSSDPSPQPDPYQPHDEETASGAGPA